MRRRLLSLVATCAFIGLPHAARAQEDAARLGRPAARDGASRILPPTSMRARDESEAARPTPRAAEAYTSARPMVPPTGAVPAPPTETPRGYAGPDHAAPLGRYPSSDGAVTLDEGARVPSRIATRLRVLDADFQTLSARGGGDLVDGILSIVTGGLSITLGIVIDNALLSPYLYTYGGAGIARGIIDMTLAPDPSTTAIAFSNMPMGNMGEVRARLAYGEDALEGLADRTRLARILDASINIAAGVAVVPIFLEPNDYEINEFGAFVMIGAGISVVSGLINLLSSSEAERRWDAYQELRSRIGDDDEVASAERDGDSTRLRYGAVPLPGGGALTIAGDL